MTNREYSEAEMEALVDVHKALLEQEARQKYPEMFREPTNFTRGKRGRRIKTRRHKQVKRLWKRLGGKVPLRQWARANCKDVLVAKWLAAKGMSK